VGRDVAEGIGALFGAVRSGFTSSSRSQGTTITHVYHGRDNGSNAVAVVLVGGSATLAGYLLLCWWKGWDMFGLSQKQTQEMIRQLRSCAKLHVPYCLSLVRSALVAKARLHPVFRLSKQSQPSHMCTRFEVNVQGAHWTRKSWRHSSRIPIRYMHEGMPLFVTIGLHSCAHVRECVFTHHDAASHSAICRHVFGVSDMHI
jgi:hypothetical protein